MRELLFSVTIKDCNIDTFRYDYVKVLELSINALNEIANKNNWIVTEDGNSWTGECKSARKYAQKILKEIDVIKSKDGFNGAK